MGRIVIVAYRPKPGRDAALEALMQRHHQRLHGEGLVTEREPVLMRAADGTIVEVFEWRSQQAMASAHDNPRVQQMWAERDGMREEDRTNREHCVYAGMRMSVNCEDAARAHWGYEASSLWDVVQRDCRQLRRLQKVRK